MFQKIIKGIKKPKLFFTYFQQITHKYIEALWAILDARSINHYENVLFIDLGANLGQGFTWFSKFFNKNNITFELFEPNPNCYRELIKLPRIASGEVLALNAGAGLETGTAKFYGLGEEEGGDLSQGGSVLRDHNSDWYDASEDSAINIKLINFSEYLEKKSSHFNKIIVKMDIEGAEVDLLEGLIKRKSIFHIDVLYLEFHSQYQQKVQSRKTRARELKIIEYLKNLEDFKLRIWH